MSFMEAVAAALLGTLLLIGVWQSLSYQNSLKEYSEAWSKWDQSSEKSIELQAQNNRLLAEILEIKTSKRGSVTKIQAVPRPSCAGQVSRRKRINEN